ncbi:MULTISPECIES: hypothetical protein [Actinosynnema]|uniref:hypothetical protein n=1 Tax=Actinosynnema TaxID=40566 RepID=UPI0020A2FFFF|nr:hypothetical protein [Actinosynnema pretiosum]MCP2096942.1 hypothetical protein [Actinosynnema pretiosum]
MLFRGGARPWVGYPPVRGFAAERLPAERFSGDPFGIGRLVAALSGVGRFTAVLFEAVLSDSGSFGEGRFGFLLPDG